MKLDTRTSIRSSAFALSAVTALLAMVSVHAYESMDFLGLRPTHRILMTPGTTTQIEAGKSYDMTASGDDFGIHRPNDEGRFLYTTIEGDFDVSVQVASLTIDNPNTFAKAGILARPSLNSDDLFVHVTAPADLSPFAHRETKDSYYFGRRFVVGGSLYNSKYDYAFDPSYEERTYPNVWIRLTRKGNEFRGYKSKNGIDWKEWGAPAWRTVDLGKKLYVGLTLSSYVEPRKREDNAGEYLVFVGHVAKAQFRNIKGLPYVPPASARAVIRPHRKASNLGITLEAGTPGFHKKALVQSPSWLRGIRTTHIAP